MKILNNIRFTIKRLRDPFSSKRGKPTLRASSLVKIILGLAQVTCFLEAKSLVEVPTVLREILEKKCL